MHAFIDISNKFYKIASALSNPTIAYHTGAFRLENEVFSVKYLKSGEGLAYLGPGTYFVNDEKTARSYAKYRPNDATLYECKIDISRCYDPFKGEPQIYRGVLEKIGQELLEEFNLKALPYASNLDFGVFEIGQTHKLLGAQKAIEKFIKHGFSGFVQEISPGIYELCIFDYSTVQILDKKLLVELKENKKSDFDNYEIISGVITEELSVGDIFYYDYDRNQEKSFIAKTQSVSDDGIKCEPLVGKFPFKNNFISFKESDKVFGMWWKVIKK